MSVGRASVHGHEMAVAFPVNDDRIMFAKGIEHEDDICQLGRWRQQEKEGKFLSPCYLNLPCSIFLPFGGIEKIGSEGEIERSPNDILKQKRFLKGI